MCNIFLYRDSFVEEVMKPVNRIITESNLEFIFNLDDESLLVRINILYCLSITLLRIVQT